MAAVFAFHAGKTFAILSHPLGEPNRYSLDYYFGKRRGGLLAGVTCEISRLTPCGMCQWTFPFAVQRRTRCSPIKENFSLRILIFSPQNSC